MCQTLPLPGAALPGFFPWALARARAVQLRHPWLGNQLRRMALLAWWTATFQLHIHARYWLRARRLRRGGPTTAERLVRAPVDPLTLVMPLAAEPVVSIIVPTFGKVAYTLRCLASIAEHTGETPIEVIVVDDDGAATQLDLVLGIRLIRNDINLGFLHSCNKAAAAALGRYLLFLNNDTEVLANWLEPMLALFRDRPDTGAVGAKLLYPDGRLQEAGGIVWNDGSGWNFGRLESPDRPEYNYVREVDYCSGAALMVQSSVFAGLGGFDPRYAPAYYEDTDLCFRLRQRGLKTLYQPAARVVHHEGVSHGTDTAVGGKAYQTINRKTFIETWKDVLVRDHFANAEHVFRARERTKGRQVALVIDHYIPTPDRDAGSRAIASCMRAMQEVGYCVKFWPQNLSYSAGYTEALQRAGIEVFHAPLHIPFQQWIARNGAELDLVLISRPDVADEMLPFVRRHSSARIVYFGHDLHFRRMAMQADVTGDASLRSEADTMLDRELAIWQQANVSVYLSDEEAQIVSSLDPTVCVRSVVPYRFEDFWGSRPAPSAPGVIFVAGFGHPPNEDAARWFVSEVWPKVVAAIPRATLSIIGSDPTRAVRALARPGIKVRANVSDSELSEAYQRARVAVVPLRCGAGVKLKVVEALRAGIPLVTTSVGAQGLPGLFSIASIEDNAGHFAEAVITLLHDDALWETRCARQTDFARQRFSAQAVRESVAAALAA